jgi:predicted dehydrogenase
MASRNAGKQASDTLKIGIMVSGYRAGAHSRLQATDNAEIVALCDLNTERAQKVAQDTGVENAQIFSDHRAMLDSATSTPFRLLAEQFSRAGSIDCLKADKHVLCEKAAGDERQRRPKIADAAAKNNKKCMVAQVNRFRADSKYLERIASRRAIWATSTTRTPAGCASAAFRDMAAGSPPRR